jgi:hypothetical protein
MNRINVWVSVSAALWPRRDGPTLYFDYDSATATFKPDATGVVTCGFSCHTRVAAKDYIFTGYATR